MQVNAPKYTMESIDPGKARRAPKVYQPPASDETPRASTTEKGKGRAIDTTSDGATATPPPKRRKSNAEEPVTPRPRSTRKPRTLSGSSCYECGKQDVPLLHDGSESPRIILHGLY
jgi:hypothetical protein